MRCLYCHREKVVYPVKEWNKDVIKYYCADHREQALSNEYQQMKRFVDYYSNPHTFEWLNEKQKDLYKFCVEKIKKGKDG